MDFNKIAKTIVNTNMELKRKDIVIINAGPKSLAFAEALAFECYKIGAQPTIFYGSSRLASKIYKTTKPEYLKDLPRLAEIINRKADAKIVIDETNPFIEDKMPQKKIELRRKATKPLEKMYYKRIFQKKYKVSLVGFPTEEEAKALGISYAKLKKIYFDTMNVNFKNIYDFNKKLSRKFISKNKIRIVGEKTDLEISIKNRKPLTDCGIVSKETESYLNLPTGEVFFAPVENSANGEIYFDLPCLWHYGKRVKGVWFKFKNGRVIDYKIEHGQKVFEDVMDNASGQKDRIAELGIGTNPKAKITGGTTIIDEKVKGTIHIAIGSNDHFGGKNYATIHWDFFKDLRKNGQIFVDGKLIMKNGQFLI